MLLSATYLLATTRPEVLPQSPNTKVLEILFSSSFSSKLLMKWVHYPSIEDKCSTNEVSIGGNQGIHFYLFNTISRLLMLISSFPSELWLLGHRPELEECLCKQKLRVGNVCVKIAIKKSCHGNLCHSLVVPLEPKKGLFKLLTFFLTSPCTMMAKNLSNKNLNLELS